MTFTELLFVRCDVTWSISQIPEFESWLLMRALGDLG